MLGTDYISVRSGGTCNCDLHCPDQGLEAEAAGDEGADARSEALHVALLEDAVQKPDKDACACACSGRASRMPGEVWPALLWSRDLSCSRRRWDGMQGTNGQPDRLSFDAGRRERNGKWYVVPALKQRVTYRNAERPCSAVTPMSPLFDRPADPHCALAQPGSGSRSPGYKHAPGAGDLCCGTTLPST